MGISEDPCSRLGDDFLERGLKNGDNSPAISPRPEAIMTKGNVREQLEVACKRNREDESVSVDEATDDPLFVTKKRKRERTVVRAKKNAIVKHMRRIDCEVENPEAGADHDKKDPEAKARRYQLEIVQEARKKNTIAYLETGCGKTLIAVLLLKQLADRFRMPDHKRIAIFLVPTVALVYQQSKVIDVHTDLKFGLYAGHMNVDSWKPEKWLKEVDEHEILVMTPQILVDLLTHGIMKLNIVEILIFDECHHTGGKHPYSRVMDRYRETPEGSRPQIFGMTASPVNGKGVTSAADANKQLSKLEQKLDSTVYAVKDRSELEAFVPTPHTIERDYEASTFPTDEHKSKLREIAEEHCVYKGATEQQFKDYDELRKKLRKAINKLYNALQYCLDALGLSCALKAAELLLKEDAKDLYMEPDVDVVVVLKSAKDSFLKKCQEYLQPIVPSDVQNGQRWQVEAGLITPKVKLLVDVLMEYRDLPNMRCIVFVDRVVASLVLARLINQTPGLSSLGCTYIAGVNSSMDNSGRKSQQAAIEEFRAGQFSVMVATNVAEEGLDVQGCHSVIRFDMCKSVRSHIQSRGRARRPGSDYIVFMEKGNTKEKDKFINIVRSENKMAEKALDRSSETDVFVSVPAVELESYRVESTGAFLNTDLSINFMFRFCAKLPGDKYYTPRPEFSFREESGAMHVCILTLPLNCPIQELTGPARKTQILAKQMVCLEACTKLHAMGAINDNLIPVVDEVAKPELVKTGTKRCGAGTTKQKELHNSISMSLLKGSWGDTIQGASLYAYELKFSSNSFPENYYGSLIFLVEAKLDEDVAQLKVDLMLRLGKMVTAQFNPAGRVDLTAQQLGCAKECQHLFLNGMFGKLLTRASKVPGAISTHKTLLSAKIDELWNSKKIYLLLPARTDSAPTSSLDPQIDWKGIKDTAAAARMFRSIYTKLNDGATAASGDEVPREWPVRPPCYPGHVVLNMAFGCPMKVADVIDTVVLTVHTGMIYVVTKVQEKTASASFSFPEREDGKANDGPKFSSYCDYFARKHKHPLKYPDQPLLQAKQTHRPRNLLARNSLHFTGKKKQKGNVVDEEPATVDIPPELCVVLGISSAVLRSAYLFPSVMHRLEAALTASKLRQIIRVEKPDSPFIPFPRIVEALTTMRCLEEFSLEGLELLGDSFLKYAVSSNLFLEFDTSHEGQLSARRSQAISNANLHSLAMSHRLPEYIRDEVFDPSRWLPPGMHSLKIILCRCDLANLRQCGTELVIGDEKDDMDKRRTKVVKVGKSCANGHRWLCSKTISDVVESLIGAYLVEGGVTGALSFMTWAGFCVEVDTAKVEKARTNSPIASTVNVGSNLTALESILRYTFTNRALLVEAITHASYQGLRGSCCYQRLEFLGDAVLDLLITRHLYSAHPGLTPGYLTDLRSAAVNNECFARVAVKHNFNKYLRHGSGFLLKQIGDFVDTFRQSADATKDSSFGWDGVKGPKVLGDMVESITGAIFVDSGFNLELVWEVMKPLLSPIVTPETLPLHPIRELQELCHLQNFGMVLQVIHGEEIPRVIIDVDMGEAERKLSVTSSNAQRRTCHKEAAQQMLGLLEKLEIWHPRKVSVLGERRVRPTPLVEEPEQDTSSSCRDLKVDHADPRTELVEAPQSGLEIGRGHKRKLDKVLEDDLMMGNCSSAQQNSVPCCTLNLCTSEHKDLELEAPAVVVPVL